MRRMIYFIVTLFALFYMDNVFAVCSNNEKSLYKKITANINISYDYTMNKKTPYFNLTFDNVVNVYLTDEKGKSYNPDANNQVIVTGLLPGRSYKFTAHGIPTCTGQQVGTLYANIPTYNSYYDLSVCDDAREYSLCQKWVSHGLDKSSFIKNVENYIKERDFVDNEPVKSKFGILNFILSLFTNIWFYVVLIPIVVFIIIKVIKAKKDREKFGF